MAAAPTTRQDAAARVSQAVRGVDHPSASWCRSRRAPKLRKEIRHGDGIEGALAGAGCRRASILQRGDRVVRIREGELRYRLARTEDHPLARGRVGADHADKWDARCAQQAGPQRGERL
jgi:hypothetical protein